MRIREAAVVKRKPRSGERIKPTAQAVGKQQRKREPPRGERLLAMTPRLHSYSNHTSDQVALLLRQKYYLDTPPFAVFERWVTDYIHPALRSLRARRCLGCTSQATAILKMYNTTIGAANKHIFKMSVVGVRIAAMMNMARIA